MGGIGLWVICKNGTWRQGRSGRQRSSCWKTFSSELICKGGQFSLDRVLAVRVPEHQALPVGADKLRAGARAKAFSAGLAGFEHLWSAHSSVLSLGEHVKRSGDSSLTAS